MPIICIVHIHQKLIITAKLIANANEQMNVGSHTNNQIDAHELLSSLISHFLPYVDVVKCIADEQEPTKS